ncbi:acetyl-CoA C-acetyltransferase [Psychrobacter sp. CAL346-MNA-CIBAN-0220]|uniref:acetyl-CoA C-acetyltransferase n=1 Tax=Psychrobacter sp. CAL346-MNA-CIBAN-0220 TaxID=3140457 RepID=UPI00331F0176
MQTAYIYDAIRTPRGKGKANGGLHQATPIWLVRTLLNSIQQRNDLDTSLVDDVVLGCVTPIGEQGADIARIAVIDASWHETVAGVTLSRFCASGLESINLAASKIMSGMEDMVVAGGVESMSRVQMGSDGGAWYVDPRVNTSTQFAPQGVGADTIATLEGFNRQEVDAFAAESHRRAATAWQSGYYDNAVIPIYDLNGRLLLDKDETIRPDTTVETLAGLKPSFATLGKMGFDSVLLDKYTSIERINHVHHAGNSSGIVDGSALCLLGSKSAGQKAGLRPRAKVIMASVIGSEPSIMLTGPTPACQKALKKAGMTAADIDLWEINEAFAAVPMKTAKDLGISLDKVNVNGGAIAMGHPLGATGAMLLTTVLEELERRDLRTAMITLCVGGGMGIATIIERV